MEVTATLRNARRIEFKGATVNLHGQLYDDKRNRGLTEGAWIYTSRVVEELPNSVFRTLNSAYQVEFAV